MTMRRKVIPRQRMIRARIFADHASPTSWSGVTVRGKASSLRRTALDAHREEAGLAAVQPAKDADRRAPRRLRAEANVGGTTRRRSEQLEVAWERQQGSVSDEYPDGKKAGRVAGDRR